MMSVAKPLSFSLAALFFTLSAHSDQSAAADKDPIEKNELQGKPVELIHGSGFSSLQASVAERTIEDAGCPADVTVLGEGDQIMVNVAGKMVIVTADVLDASSEAIEHCVLG